MLTLTIIIIALLAIGANRSMRETADADYCRQPVVKCYGPLAKLSWWEGFCSFFTWGGTTHCPIWQGASAGSEG